MTRSAGILISCEVGGDQIPPPLVDVVGRAARHGRHKKRNASNAPRKPDKIAAQVASTLAANLDARRIVNPCAIDLIDVSRSLHNRNLFSAMTRQWPAEDRRRLIELIYDPYRNRIRDAITALLARSSYVLHLSVRTFPLHRNGKILRADAGLLYDPANDDEYDFCLDWIDEMYDVLPMLRVRRNYPQRGTSDRITRAMRHQFAGQPYLGVELMLNRAWVARPVAIRDEVLQGICDTLRAITETAHSEAA